MLEWLQSLKLSITQWVVLSLVAVVGALLALLKHRSSQVYQARVELLKAQIAAGTAADDARVEAARKKFEQALKEYYADSNS